ncbi:MAG: rod shape-determining protein MreD [Gammaproteobacteria bacterium]|nr:rod shape-determining protein MreD [Gammaproteobacteria bacterium]
MSARYTGGWVIALSLVSALLLTLLPMPAAAQVYRPEWVALVLIYWCLAVPERVGVGIAWVMGILLDVINGALLGQHALALAVVAYIAIKLHRQARLFPVWQQAFMVMLLIIMEQMLNLWVQGVIGQPPRSWKYWLPALTSMLLWPWVFFLLRDLRRRYVTNG